MTGVDFLSILIIAIGLSADCFGVALSGSISMGTVSFLQVFRASLAFGLFQALMPVLGWLVGRTIADVISAYDHWVAFVLLLAVGLTLALLKVNIALASSTIGGVAFVITTMGFLVGRKVGKLLGRRAEAIGGIVLIAIGLRIILTHVW